MSKGTLLREMSGFHNGGVADRRRHRLWGVQDRGALCAVALALLALFGSALPAGAQNLSFFQLGTLELDFADPSISYMQTSTVMETSMWWLP